MAQGTTISEMLQNLAESKTAIIAALTAKGVTVPSGAKFEDIAALVEQVEGGGSSEVTDISAYLPAWEADRHTMTEVVVPGGVTKIGDYSFYMCNKLTSLVIPDGVTSIGRYAFSGCMLLESLSIPSTVNSIGENAFYNCKKITSLVIPNGVKSINTYSFYNCNALTSLVIPEGVTTIGNYAFSGCNKLASLVIPEGVESIGMSAFSSCGNLKSLVIPGSVMSIGMYAFQGFWPTYNFQFFKTMSEVSAMENYPWDIIAGTVIHCTDGDLTV